MCTMHFVSDRERASEALPSGLLNIKVGRSSAARGSTSSGHRPRLPPGIHRGSLDERAPPEQRQRWRGQRIGVGESGVPLAFESAAIGQNSGSGSLQPEKYVW